MPSSKVTDKQVMKALENCHDPEMGISVVDLGLIMNISIDDGDVKLHMIFVTKHCPFHPMVAQKIHAAVMAVPGVSGVEIEVDRDTDWKPDMMTEKGKKTISG